jgi:hypothetical protein
MARGRKGAGSVFQRTYRDAHGRKMRTKNWYIEYVAGGRTIREATEYTKRSDAIEFLKKRVSDGLNGKIVLCNQVLSTISWASATRQNRRTAATASSIRRCSTSAQAGSINSSRRKVSAILLSCSTTSVDRNPPPAIIDCQPMVSRRE